MAVAEIKMLIPTGEETLIVPQGNGEEGQGLAPLPLLLGHGVGSEWGWGGVFSLEYDISCLW